MSKENIIRVRNAIFEAGDGITLDEIMQGIMMAQAKLVAHAVNGDELEAHKILEQYRRYQSEAMPIYCAEEVSPVQ